MDQQRDLKVNDLILIKKDNIDALDAWPSDGNIPGRGQTPC